MSSVELTVTTTCLDQIELVNIVSISELRLQRNFELLMKCLQDHANRFDSIERTVGKQARTIENLTEKCNVDYTESVNRIDGFAAGWDELKSHMASINKTIEKNSLQTKESIALITDQLRILNCLNDDRTLTSQQHFRDIEKQLQNVVNVTGKIDFETEKYRKEAGVLSVKADTAFKKAKLLEQKVLRIDEKVAKVQAQSVLLKQTLCSTFGDNEIFPLEINDTFDQKPLEEGENQKQKKPLPPSERKKRFAILSSEGMGHQGIRITLQEMKKRLQQLETNSKELNSKTVEKWASELNEIKSLKSDIKKEIQKQKSQGSMGALAQKVDQLRPQLNNVFGRMDIVQDKHFSIQRKMDQIKRSILQMNCQLKENNNLKFEERIRMFQSDLLSQLKELGSRLDLKVDTSDFTKERQVTDQKFKQINQILGIKCDKVQVKKALLFIESKIKQIILVISQDQQNERQALLTKKNIKCISCDKQLDKFSGLVGTDTKAWNMMPNKELHTDSLGKFGISRYGSLAKKLRKLQSNDLPILRGGRKTTE